MANLNLSSVESSNSTKSLHDSYQELMQITDPAELMVRATTIVRTAGGISENNLRTFEHNLRKCGGSLARMQGYISNYILKGCGLGVI